jgi:hypothetical protein
MRAKDTGEGAGVQITAGFERCVEAQRPQGNSNDEIRNSNECSNIRMTNDETKAWRPGIRFVIGHWSLVIGTLIRISSFVIRIWLGPSVPAQNA